MGPFHGLDPALETGVVVLVVVGLAAAVVAVGRRRRYRRLAEAFEPGSAVVRLFRVEGRWNGYTFLCSVQERSRHSPGGLRLVTRVAAPERWRAVMVGQGPLAVELAGLGLAQLGLLQDVEIGDPMLDRALRFAGENPEHLSGILQPEVVRVALRSLVALPNFRSIDVRRGRVSVHFRPRTPALDDSPQVLRARMKAVANLLSTLGYSPAFGSS